LPSCRIKDIFRHEPEQRRKGTTSHEATWIAESRYGFIEADVTAADDLHRNW